MSLNNLDQSPALDDIAPLVRAVKLLLGARGPVVPASVTAEQLAAFDIVRHAALFDALARLRVAGIVIDYDGEVTLCADARGMVALHGVGPWLRRKLAAAPPPDDLGNTLLRAGRVISGEAELERSGAEIDETTRLRSNEIAAALAKALGAWGARAPAVRGEVRELREQVERQGDSLHRAHALLNDVRRALHLKDGVDVVEGATALRSLAEEADRTIARLTETGKSWRARAEAAEAQLRAITTVEA